MILIRYILRVMDKKKIVISDFNSPAGITIYNSNLKYSCSQNLTQIENMKALLIQTPCNKCLTNDT